MAGHNGRRVWRVLGVRTELGIVNGKLGVGLASYDDNGVWTDDSSGVQDWVNNIPYYPPSGGGGTSIWDAITKVISPVIKSQFPAIPEGSVLIQGPNGTQYIRYASGQQVPWTGTSVSGTVGGNVTGQSSNLLIMAAVAAFALMALKK